MASLLFTISVFLVLGFPVHLVAGLINPKLAFLNQRKAPKRYEAVLLSLSMLVVATTFGVASVSIDPNISSEEDATLAEESVIKEVDNNQPIPVDSSEEYKEIPASLYSYVGDYEEGEKFDRVTVKQKKDTLLVEGFRRTTSSVSHKVKAELNLKTLTTTGTWIGTQRGVDYPDNLCENSQEICYLELNDLGKYTEIEFYQTGDYFKNSEGPQTVDNPSTNYDDRDYNYKKVNGEWAFNKFTLVVPTEYLKKDKDQIDTFEVSKVSDGDTITVVNKTTNETNKVRLACIDAPELDQPGGDESRYALEKVLDQYDNSQLSLNTIDTDRYGRLVSEIFVDEVNINQAMVEAGAAVIYDDYFTCDDKDGYINAQQIAKSNNSNIWSDSDFIMPWEWRRGKRNVEKVEPSYTPPSNVINNNGYISGSCKTLKAKGLSQFRKGDPNYTSKRDRDNDGVGCE